MVFQRPLTETFLGEHAPRHPFPTPPPPFPPSPKKNKAAFDAATFLPRTPSKSYATSLQAATCLYTEGGRFMHGGSTVLAY